MCESNPSEDMASFEVLNNTGMTDSLDSSEFSIISDQPPATIEENLLNGNFNSVQAALMSASQDLSMQEIQARVVELAKDNASMKEALKWNNVMMQEQLSTISAWHNEMTTSMSKQQLSLRESSAKVDALQAENAQLKEKLQQLEESSKNEDDCKAVKIVASSSGEPNHSNALQTTLKSEDPISEIEDLRKALQEKDSLKANFDLLKQENEALKSERINLQNQLKEHCDKETERSNEVQTLKMEISDLGTKVLLEKQATESESIRHGETKKLLSVLQSQYDRVYWQLEQARSINQNQRAFCEADLQQDKLKKYMEQIDNLTAQVFDMEEKLAEREEKANLLTAQLQTVNKDSESIPVLKSQVEVYKEDLNQARQARDEAEVEIQRLNKVVQDLQARLNAIPPPSKERPHRGGPKYTCPLCDFGFNDAQAAQNHANKCLDEALAYNLN